MGPSQKVKLIFHESFEKKCFRLLTYAYQILNKQNDISIKSLRENDISELINKNINESQLSIDWKITSTTEHKIFKNSQRIEKGFADKLSRIDLNMHTIHYSKRYFYHIEAKNLKEYDKSLLKRYIETGIDNFLSKKYINGCLVGYLLHGDVNSTIRKINALLSDSARKDERLKKVECVFHDCYYESNHKDIDVLKHLIFNFT